MNRNSASPACNVESAQNGIQRLQYCRVRQKVASNQLDRFGRVAFNKQMNLSQASLIVSSNSKSSNNSSELLRFNSAMRRKMPPLGIFTDKEQRFEAF